MRLLSFSSADSPSSHTPKSRLLVQRSWGLCALLCTFLLLLGISDLAGVPLIETSSIQSLFGIGEMFRGKQEPYRSSRGISRRSDWISSWDPPEGYEDWLGFAKLNQCHMGSYSRIEKDLEQFRDERQPWKRRITKAQIEATKKIGNIVVFSVKHGKLKINGEKTPFAKKFAGLLKRFVQYLPDMEFVVNSLDEPRSLPGETEDLDTRYASKQCANASETFQKYRHLHGTFNNRFLADAYKPNTQLLPIFSQSKINECHADIQYPTLYNLNNILTDAQEKALRPWESRIPILFFRGANTGGDYVNGSDFSLAHRQRLVEHAKDHSDMDIQFSNYVQCSEEVCEQMAARYGTGNWVNQMTNFKYKFLMSIDGNTFVSRLPLFLSSGSVPFRAGIYSEWFDEWIKENEHYIQIKLDYSDLDYKLQWALDHDDKMRAIGQRARRFAKTRLRNEDMECYLYRLLLEYAAMVF